MEMKINIDDVILDNDDDETQDDVVPHVVMQFKKAIDVGGKYSVTFQNGDKVVVPLTTIHAFMNIYQSIKPMDREQMQSIASRSYNDLQMSIQEYLSKDSAPGTIYR